ncbi:MAG: hypothetical protein GX042_02045 [Bacteroidales bacterium]|jgi:hypothetical protein|nr:hypothetical protein [Bacteroidales bacterium]
MKKHFLLATILLSACSLFAQQPEGTYKNGLDSLAFTNGKATFRLTGFAGLSVAQVGEGSYELTDQFLLIHTTDYSGFKSSSQALEGSRKDTCVVKVVGMHNYPIQTILVEAKNKSDKMVEAKVTDSEGKIYLTMDDKMTSLAVSSLGYNAIAFDYTPGKDYLVRLAENDVIEARTVVFSIDFIDDETISLLLLTDDFDTSKNKVKELQKLEKKARKSKLLDKRLKKVYVPYERKL